MNLTGQLLPVTDLTDFDRAQMCSLMETYYENADRLVFEADLNEKQWVILLQHPINGDVLGFSTQMMLDVTVDGQPVRALFSGDTIVDREHWAKNPLAQIWGQFALSLIDADGSEPLYWFLMSKGYKTYRFLPVFFHEFYPTKDRPTPVCATRVIDALGRYKYPDTYDSAAGVVRYSHDSCRLRPKVAELTSRRLQNPHIQFFAKQNPDHARGDELCCIAPLTRENFTSAAYRVIHSTPVLSEVDS